MHPRNPFKLQPPKFGELAKKYAELRPFCFIGAGGKVQIDFDNDNAADHLSVVLLREYFGLHVQFPPHALVPRIPQKVNYILLIEDLINLNNIRDHIVGVDIGTGASCIYPLLGAAMNTDWLFYATELAESSRTAAVTNVQLNCGLVTDRIIVVPTSSPSAIFQELVDQIDEGVILTFSICNPPFFTDEEEKVKFCSISGSSAVLNVVPTTSRRGAPRSSTTAGRHELATDGGEVGFVRRMIAESQPLCHRIRIFTTMLGKKASLAPLVDTLRGLDADVRFASYTLDQGRTGRWVLAWTYQPDIHLPKL